MTSPRAADDVAGTGGPDGVTPFPVPVRDDDERRVYISVGHQQMMTDAMKPLGLSVWQLTAGRPMFAAGGRPFVDVTEALASTASRDALVQSMGKSDPLIADALQSVIDRGDFIPARPENAPAAPAAPAAPPTGGLTDAIATEPAIVEELIARTEASVAATRRGIRGQSGPELFDYILEDIQDLKRSLFADPRNLQAIMAGIESLWWLNDQLLAWLGEKNAADALTQSVDHNVTSEMGLALLDVADAIRPHPKVVALLEQVGDEFTPTDLDGLVGGSEARAAIEAWLAVYGMRCVGEIDITRPRWSERPAALVPVILGNVRNAEPGARRVRFAQGLHDAQAKEAELLERLRALPDGQSKADETERMIRRLRTFIGYREYPKYGIICRYFAYKWALMDEAERLVRAGVISAADDVFFLTFQELHDAVRTGHVEAGLVTRRRAEFRSYEALTPPRVLTSDGELLSGAYQRSDAPAGALIGLAVSAGSVEGRARVILDMWEADLEPGDILVTTHTDPSWTPLFVGITALVTEVGGLMTHGAVIAREYGLPAVVGVEHATQLIRDGQRIRVDGTNGHVEFLG